MILYQSVKNKLKPTITKGDKTVDPTEFFGMWKEQPKNLADIRKKHGIVWNSINEKKHFSTQ